MPIEVACQVCGRKYRIRPSYLRLGRMKTCSKTCGYRIVATKLRDANNGQWNNSRDLTAIHNWVRRRKPKPQRCENCHEAPPLDLANISQQYYRDVNDFKWLCRSCHMNEDGRLSNLLHANRTTCNHPLHKHCIRSITTNNANG